MKNLEVAETVKNSVGILNICKRFKKRINEYLSGNFLQAHTKKNTFRIIKKLKRSDKR